MGCVTFKLVYPKRFKLRHASQIGLTPPIKDEFIYNLKLCTQWVLIVTLEVMSGDTVVCASLFYVGYVLIDLRKMRYIGVATY